MAMTSAKAGLNLSSLDGASTRSRRALARPPAELSSLSRCRAWHILPPSTCAVSAVRSLSVLQDCREEPSSVYPQHSQLSPWRSRLSQWASKKLGQQRRSTTLRNRASSMPSRGEFFKTVYR